ncbi:MAG: hypothetical protein IJN49_09145 [Clostridia bacterium]|nr:hypothetical protein [Clostridia bacterium]
MIELVVLGIAIPSLKRRASIKNILSFIVDGKNQTLNDRINFLLFTYNYNQRVAFLNSAPSTLKGVALKFSILLRVKDFHWIFCVEGEVRLTPCKTETPKRLENTRF